MLSDGTLTNTEVTEESVAAFARCCQLPSDATLNSAEVTDACVTALVRCQVLSDVT